MRIARPLPTYGRRLRVRVHERRLTQGTPESPVVVALHGLPALPHFGDELFVGQRQRRRDVYEHAGYRATTASDPVPVVREVLVGARRVQEPDEVQDGALRQQRLG